MSTAAKRTVPRIVVVMSFAVAIVLVFVAITLVLVTGADVSQVEGNQSVVAGPEAGLRTQVETLGAVYYANPLGGDGFWLTAVGGDLVALPLMQDAGDRVCELEFQRETKAFGLCDESVDPAVLAKLPITIEDGTVSVDVRATSD